jgi:hypothetical protein
MQFSKLITFCTICRRYGALRAVWLCAKCCILYPLGYSKVTFCKSERYPASRPSQTGPPPPPTRQALCYNITHSSASGAHRQRIASAAVAQRILYQIGSRKGARREPLRQRHASNALATRPEVLPLLLPCYVTFGNTIATQSNTAPSATLGAIRLSL